MLREDWCSPPAATPLRSRKRVDPHPLPLTELCNGHVETHRGRLNETSGVPDLVEVRIHHAHHTVTAAARWCVAPCPHLIPTPCCVEVEKSFVVTCAQPLEDTGPP